MALSSTSVKKAIEILKKINPASIVKKYEIYDPEEDYSSVKHIHCVDEKGDGGFENVFTNIKDISTKQLKLWNEVKNEIPNTSVERILEGTNITHICWF